MQKAKRRYVNLPSEPDDTVHLAPGVDFRTDVIDYVYRTGLFLRVAGARRKLAAADAKE